MKSIFYTSLIIFVCVFLNVFSSETHFLPRQSIALDKLPEDFLEKKVGIKDKGTSADHLLPRIRGIYIESDGEVAHRVLIAFAAQGIIDPQARINICGNAKDFNNLYPNTRYPFRGDTYKEVGECKSGYTCEPKKPDYIKNIFWMALGVAREAVEQAKNN
jgi:hypothetical protein